MTDPFCAGAADLFVQAWRVWGVAGAALVLGSARYPRRSAGMTDLFCAGAADLFCAGVAAPGVTAARARALLWGLEVGYGTRAGGCADSGFDAV